MEKFVDSTKPIKRLLHIMDGDIIIETLAVVIEGNDNGAGTPLDAKNLNAIIKEIEDIKVRIVNMNNIDENQDIGAVKAEGETFASETTLGYYNKDEEIKMFAARARVGCRPTQETDTHDFSEGSYWDFSNTADDVKLFIKGGWYNSDTEKYDPTAKIGDKETYFKIRPYSYGGSVNESRIAMGTDNGQITLRTTDGDIVLQARQKNNNFAEQRIELNNGNIVIDQKDKARITLDNNGDISMNAGGFRNLWDGKINFTMSERNGIACNLDPNNPNQQIELDAKNGKISISGRGNTQINTADSSDKFNCNTELDEASYGNNDYRINFYPDKIRVHYITNKDDRSTASIMDITKDRIDFKVPVFVNGKKVLTEN